MSLSGAVSETSYIQHHLHNLQFNLLKWCFGSGGGFWTLDLDTVAVSLCLGVLFLWFFRRIARRATPKTPGRLQNAIEMFFDVVYKSVTQACRRDYDFISSLAITTFTWIFLMNFMDLIPVDLIPRFLSLFGVSYFRVVPTANPSLTFAMSITVFCFVIFYNFKVKGFVGFGKEILKEPFGYFLAPINILQRLIEECVKPVSLSLRLFGNMFAGEIVFFLIAVMPWWGELPLGFVWTMFHLLVIVIQAFIFMMLTIVYLGLAQESH